MTTPRPPATTSAAPSAARSRVSSPRRTSRVFAASLVITTPTTSGSPEAGFVPRIVPRSTRYRRPSDPRHSVLARRMPARTARRSVQLASAGKAPASKISESSGTPGPVKARDWSSVRSWSPVNRRCRRWRRSRRSSKACAAGDPPASVARSSRRKTSVDSSSSSLWSRSSPATRRSSSTPQAATSSSATKANETPIRAVIDRRSSRLPVREIMGLPFA